MVIKIRPRAREGVILFHTFFHLFYKMKKSRVQLNN
jgi:hypothetical protein